MTVAATTGILPDRYDAPRLMGRGGMGEIYVAHDRKLERVVAVKLLAERLAEEPEPPGPLPPRGADRRATLRASRTSSRSSTSASTTAAPSWSWSTCPAGRWPTAPGTAPVEPDQALAWLAQAAEALDAAHATAIVHRDVKPANLLFDSADRLQVVDFGIARVMDETAGMTAPGTVLGTAGYLAPEQAQGHETTAASDRYALAVVAYELLTGGRPFERESATAEAAAHIHEIVPPASEQADLPAAVDAVFARALAKSPVHRYPDRTAFVDALAEALRRALAASAGRRHRPAGRALPTRRAGRRRAPPDDRRPGGGAPPRRDDPTHSRPPRRRPDAAGDGRAAARPRP